MRKNFTKCTYIAIACLLLLFYIIFRKVFYKPPRPHYPISLSNWTFEPTGDIIQNKPDVLLFIAVVSAPRHRARRDAVRRSWLSLCKPHKIPCWIFTDGQEMNGTRISNAAYLPLKQEQDQHGDLILVQSPGGINFALRYLWIIHWASERYNFKFLLRVDDDYFVCLDRLLLELPHRPQEKLYWGWLHCDKRGPAIDEGFIIVSKDLIEEFLKELNKSLMCLPFGGATIAVWINNIKEKVHYFGDNERLLHLPDKGASDEILQEHSDLCASFLGIHRSYPVEMDKYWRKHISTQHHERRYVIVEMTYPCEFPEKTFNHKLVSEDFLAVAYPCKWKPIYGLASFYGGRT